MLYVLCAARRNVAGNSLLHTLSTMLPVWQSIACVHGLAQRGEGGEGDGGPPTDLNRDLSWEWDLASKS